jgi:cellobiose phosphorylase
MAQYGYFDDETGEYVITDPRTPVKWINYIGDLSFGGFIDQTGGTQLCKGDPALNRITRYSTQIPASDFRGETAYIRLAGHERGRTVFSPYFVPTLSPFDRFECRVGSGYSRWTSEILGIRCEVTVFVPRGDCRVLRDYRVTNLRSDTVVLDLVPVVEYSHFDALKQLTNADWVPQTMQGSAVYEPGRFLTLLQYAFMKRETAVNFFTASLPVSSFETDRKRFLGANEYGSWRSPLSLDGDEMGNYEARRGDNIGALMLHLGSLKPGETRRVVTQLGQAASFASARAGIERFRKTGEVEAAFSALGDFWKDYLGHARFITPDPAMNRMLGVYNPRQCYVTRTWSRYLSLYQLGYGGDRGIGFRDSSQDVMGILDRMPGEGLSLLLKLLSVQRRDGSAMHQFNPLTMEGGIGDSAEYPDRPHYYGDDHLWVVLAVIAYLKETGDLGLLDTVVPFYEKDGSGTALESASVLDHLRRALDFTSRDTGAHGLPLLGFADWNDTVNLASGAESVFTAMLYGRALLEAVELFNKLRDSGEAARRREAWERMGEAVNVAAWDGEWYRRWFAADGSVLGSSENQAGKIYINAQSWSVLSGFAPPERARAALDSVGRLLDTPKGIRLSWPGFDGFDAGKGGITTYPPGAKENGGIFLHTNPWVVIAEAMSGNGERAFRYYDQVNPAAKNESIDGYECEPYCYPQNILGSEHPQFGLARNTWLSGTASWMYQAATGWILGLRAEFDGLRLDPCIPADWSGFEVERDFRGARYRIVVKNPRHLSRGIATIVVDWKSMEGNLIPIFGDGKLHEVRADLG